MLWLCTNQQENKWIDNHITSDSFQTDLKGLTGAQLKGSFFFLNIGSRPLFRKENSIQITLSLLSQPVQNRHRYSDSKQWWKTLSATGLELTTLRSTMAIGKRRFWQRFSGSFSALVKLLFGTTVLSPDLLGPVTIIWSGYNPAQDLGFFDPNNTGPTARLTARRYRAM